MTEPAHPPGRLRRLPWLAAAVAGLAFFLADHDLRASLRDEYYGVELDTVEAAAGGGQWGNRIGFTMLAVMGGAFLARGGRAWNPRGVLPLLLVLWVGWSVASILWSPDPGRTARRLASLTFCLTGAIGVSRRLGGRELCWFVFLMTAGVAALGVVAEVGLGTFRPLGGGRFAGTLHPNGQGANCAFLCLSAAVLLMTGERPRGVLVAALGAGAVLLLATKSRTAMGALAVGVVGVPLLRPSPRVVAAGFVGVWVACAAALAAVLLGVDLEVAAGRTLNMGRLEETSTLSGRTDLWELLTEYASQRPWLGYGYGGFWTTARIEAVSGDQYWAISSAHSAYYEAVLGTGLIGLAVLLVVIAAGAVRAARDYVATADPGAALLFGILTGGVIQGFAESDFVLPSFPTFLAACALCRTAFFFHPDPVGGDQT